ncbi:DNA polymerase III subunit gamma/tau [Helicobacter sp.]|uniref:DNA polymerase III subunit gamma/tau n=1 Tax=Helicobacter sp. TaxID=218 RepID=UPI0025BE3D01|nr:DNA polymerase III subunit gamma/tau [Helicobacter sp.]MCI5633130.1 DNA polymerase III subunit gamma/tau [Helicobacter sp.]
MEQQALALKYRPMDFDALVGQEAVSRTLSLALDSKRLSHAYLFSGLRGSGKTSSARIFARALQCDNGPCSKPCGHCPNCVAANPHKMSHIDIIELDGASNRKIDDIRDLIEQTKYHPNMGRFKIFIIDEVHMLTREAFNALLKTLEEPPEYVKFILATTDPLKLPATILSRTQHFRFKRISDKNIFEHLKKILQLEQITYQEEALNMLIRSGAGSLRDTLTLLDQAIIYSNYNITADVCANMLGLINTQSLNLLFESIFTQDREAVLKTLEGFFEYECEMLLDEMSIFLKDKLLKGEDSRYSTLVVDRFFRIITQAKELLFLGSENSFVLTLSAFKMLEALKVESIDKAIAYLEKGFFEQLPKIENVEPKVKSQASQILQKNAQDSIRESQEPIQPSNVELQDSTKESAQDNAQALFALLTKKIYAHNYDLGEIFSKNVHFVSFKDNVLNWETLAEGKERERLKHAYSIIKNYVLEVFGMQTQIINDTKAPKQSLEIPQNIESPTASTIPLEVSNTQQHDEDLQTQVQLKQPIPQNTESKSPKDEILEMLQSPLLKDVQELLEIRQVKVRQFSNNSSLDPIQ